MTATAVILMAVPECRHDDRLLRYSPVAAEIDGELYYSGEYVYPTIVNHDRSFIFRQEENGFYVYIERLIYSDSGVTAFPECSSSRRRTAGPEPA